MHRHRSRKLWERRLALMFTTLFGWTFILAPGATALSEHQTPNTDHHGVGFRRLSTSEMSKIRGSGPLGHAESLSAFSGPAYSWEGSAAGINSGNGNKMTTVPLVSWRQLGGMPVDFSLYHNSEGTHDAELGEKWTFSYDLYLMPVGDSPPGTLGNLAMHWGNDQSYTFTNNGSNVFTAPIGIHQSLVYNIDGTLTLTMPDQTTYHFNTSYYCDTITDGNCNYISIAHNAGNYVTSITDITGREIELGYNGSNEITSVTDPLSRVWTIAYSGSNLASVTFPELGATYYSESFSYNADSNITGITTPGSRTLSFTYNSDDSLATSTDGCSNTTSIAYTTSSTTFTDANSHTLIHYYNGSGQLSEVKDNSGYTYIPTYDAYNNVTSWVDQRGYTWHATFDSAANNLTSVDPYSDTVTRTFSGTNKLLTETQPTGESVALTRDGRDNVTAVAYKNSSGVTEATESMTYSASGELLTRTDSNSNETQYGHSTNGDLTSVTTPSGKETQFGVDGIGTRTSRIDAESRETDYTLDAWERCTTTTYPDSSTHGFAFDADSNLTSFVDATGTTCRYYDGDSRLTSETKGGSTVVANSYDATGKKGLLSTTTDSGSRVITYAYTGLNQLYSVAETAGTTYYSYDACSNETGETLPNGETVVRTFDHAGSLATITNSSVISGVPTTLTSYSYVVDASSRRTSCTEYSGDVVSWGYDWGGRLTSEGRTGSSAYSTSYTLDGEGRRTSQGVTIGESTATTSFTLNSDDELTATSSSSGGFTNSYSYSDNGEQIGRTLAGTAYSVDYDYDGNTTSITQGSSTVSYATDAVGRRVSRTAAGTTTNFQYAGDNVLLEKQGSTTTGTYTYGNALIRKDGETPLYDGLGSARAETNSSQAVTFTLIPDAFGNSVTTTGSTASSYGFAATSGYRTDGDAGLMKVGARYYDPQVGSFTTRDTYLDQKPYLYCEHDPVNGVDPSGHDGEDVGIGERLGQLASSSGGILLRGIMIFAPIWYGGVKVTHKFHDWFGRRYSHQKLSPHTSQGDMYGNSHEHQAKMIDVISDPDSR